MSDIPLRRLRQNRQQKRLEEEQAISLVSPETSTMPTGAVAKTAVAARRNRNYGGRRTERYADSEEEEGLLGTPPTDDGDDYLPLTQPVCFNLYVERVDLVEYQNRSLLQYLRPQSSMPKINHELFLSTHLRNCNQDTHPTLSAIKSTTHSHFYQLYSTNSSSFSSICTSFWLLYHNLFHRLRLVCVNLDMKSGQALTVLSRFHRHIHCSTSVRAVCNDGQGGL